MVNYLVLKYKAYQSQNSGVNIERVNSEADEYFALIASENIKSYLVNLDIKIYLTLAKQLYDSISDEYKEEQGDKLFKP